MREKTNKYLLSALLIGITFPLNANNMQVVKRSIPFFIIKFIDYERK